jgi:Homeodomain-like domain
MAKERTSVRMQAQIKLMSEQGHSIRSIARVLRLSRRTVRKYLEPAPQLPNESGGWEEKIDWGYVRQEVYGKGTTVKQIGQEVAPVIAYVKFWRVFREKAARQASPEQVTIRLHHKPGEKTQIDFSDGLWITDPATGNKRLTQFFLGVCRLAPTHLGNSFSIRSFPLSSRYKSVCLPTLAESPPMWWWTISKAGFTNPICTIPM